MNYYIYYNEEQMGPYTLEQMHEMLSNGDIDEEILVFVEGASDWRAAKEIEGLFAQAPVERQPEPEPPASQKLKKRVPNKVANKKHRPKAKRSQSSAPLLWTSLLLAFLTLFVGQAFAADSTSIPKAPSIDQAKVQKIKAAMDKFKSDTLLHYTFDSPYSFGYLEPDRSGQSNDGFTRWNRVRAWGGLRWDPGQGIRGGAGFIVKQCRGTMSTEMNVELPKSWTLTCWYKPPVDGPETLARIIYLKNSDGYMHMEWIGRWKLVHPGGRIESKNLEGPKRGEWNHLAVVVNEDEFSFYINGVKGATYKNPANKKENISWITKPVQVGLAGGLGEAHHKPAGHYDELQLVKGALSEAQIAELAKLDNPIYDAELPPLADANMGYTAKLVDGKAHFKMQGRAQHAKNPEETTFLWSVVKQPEGATARFHDPTDPKTYFVTDKAGDYRFKLSVMDPNGVDHDEVNGVVFAVEKAPENPKFFSYGDGTNRRKFGYEAPNPLRATAVKGKTLPVIAHWSMDDIENGVLQAVYKGKPTTVDLIKQHNKYKDAVVYSKGKHGSAIDLRKVHRPAVDLGSIPELVQEFSLSFWVFNPEKIDGTSDVFKAVGEDGKEFWKLWFYNSAKHIPESKLIYKWYQGFGMVPTGKWSHIVITYAADGDVCKLYIDGQQAPWLKRPLGEAAGKPSLQLTFRGIVDDVTLYGTTLNTEEVVALGRHDGPGTTFTQRIAQDPYQSIGYSSELLKQYFEDPEPELIKKGFAIERFGGGVKPAYEHPRLHFSMKDLPRMRAMSKQNETGHYNYAQLTLFGHTAMGWNLEKLTPNASRLEKDQGKLKKGDIVFDTANGASARVCLAYKALLEADTKLARKLIENMMESAKLQRIELDKRMKVRNDWREGYHDLVGRRQMPLMYDYLYNWMTPEERKVLRGIIADATADKYSLGMYGVAAHEAHTSNWQPWITGELYIACESIYGEEGFDPKTHQAAGRALALCATNMNDPESGAHYEGMGKSNIGLSQTSVLAHSQPADEKILASKSLYNHLDKFLWHTGLPWNHGKFMADDKLGGNKGLANTVVNVLHYAYPDDPKLNYLKRLQTTSDPWRRAGANLRTFWQESWMYTVNYLQNWSGPEDLGEHLKLATENEPLGYFSHFRGLMVSRDQWTPEAVQLYVNARVIRGGHWQPSRGYFRLNAHGREWFNFRSFGSGSKPGWIPDRNSIITVDGKTQDMSTVRVLQYEGAAEKPGATFDICTADLTAPYRHAGDRWPTMNSNRLQPDKRKWFDAPKGLLPPQLSAWVPAGKGPMTLEGIDLEATPKGAVEFEFAYRSSVFARGKYPYALILDDFKKDEQAHDYIWNGALPEDLFDVELKVEGQKAMIQDPVDGKRQLQLQMLNPDAKGNFKIHEVDLTAEHNGWGKQKHHLPRLVNVVYKSRSVHQKFHTLLYPHLQGAPTPKVEVTKDGYKITIGDQVDHVEIVKDSKGRQKVVMKRN